MIRRLIFCLAALTIVIAEAQAPAQFVAGVAKVDITPRIGRGLDGSERSQEMRDSLFARVLVLKDQHTSVAIVSIDSLVFASPVVAEEAKRQFGVQHVIQSSTHTHAGTVPEGMVIGGPNRKLDWTRQSMAPDKVIDWRGLSRDPWYDSTEQRIIAAIGEAQRKAFPARIASGSGVFESVYMAHNRRLVTSKGVTMLWENPNRLPTKPVDPTVGILRVEDLEGNVRALAVAYACHPVALMSAGILSRDYPGVMVDFIEQELGPQCQAMFLQGASGDLDPYDLHSLRGKNRENISRQAGIALAKRALAISRECKVTDQATDLVVKESLLEIPNRKPGEMTQVNLLSLSLSDQIAFAAIPGEPFVQHQLDLRASWSPRRGRDKLWVRNAPLRRQSIASERPGAKPLDPGGAASLVAEVGGRAPPDRTTAKRKPRKLSRPPGSRLQRYADRKTLGSRSLQLAPRIDRRGSPSSTVTSSIELTRSRNTLKHQVHALPMMSNAACSASRRCASYDSRRSNTGRKLLAKVPHNSPYSIGSPRTSIGRLMGQMERHTSWMAWLDTTLTRSFCWNLPPWPP